MTWRYIKKVYEARGMMKRMRNIFAVLLVFTFVGLDAAKVKTARRRRATSVAKKRVTKKKAPAAKKVTKGKPGKKKSKSKLQLKFPGLSFSQIFKKMMQDTKQSLGLMTRNLKNLVVTLRDASYYAPEVNMLTPHPDYPERQVGMIFRFNHYDISNGFKGVEIEPVVEVPDKNLKKLFDAVVQLGLKPITQGTLVEDPATKKKILRTDGFSEFLIKLFLLLQAKKTGEVSVAQFPMEMMVLAYGLYKTPGFRSARDLVTKVPPLFRPLLTSIRIKGKSVQDFLSVYFKNFKQIADYNFEKQDSSMLSKRDIPKAMKILAAIFLRSAVDYRKAKQDFLNTVEGQAIYEQFVYTPYLETGQYLEPVEFKQSVPGYQEISLKAKERLFAFLNRFSLYRAMKSKLKGQFEPFIKLLFGVGWDEMVPPDEQFPAGSESFTDQEYYQMMGDDAYFGEVEADVQEGVVAEIEEVVEEIQEVQEEIIEVPEEEGPAPIDSLYEVMQLFDELQAEGALDEATIFELEAAIMASAKEIYDKFVQEKDLYDEDGLIQIAEALRTASLYFVEQKDITEIEGYLAQIQDYAVAVGIQLPAAPAEQAPADAVVPIQ